MGLLRFLYFLMIACGVVMCNTGCLVSDKKDTQTPARIRMFNIVPNSYLSISANEVPFINKVPYDSVTPYGFGSAGLYDMILRDSISQKSIMARQLIQSDVRYSFYVIPDSNSVANNISGFKLSVVVDPVLSFDRDTIPYFYIRFLNYSPETKGRTLFIKNYRQRGSSNIFDSSIINNFTYRSYNDISVRPKYTTFTKIQTGNYKFKLFYTSDSSLQMEVPIRTFSENKYYTLYLQGFSNGVGDYSWKVNVDSMSNMN